MYVELRAHTCYSFSDGAVSAENLARRARALGYTHLGITDTADLGGIAKFGVEALAPVKDPDCRSASLHGDGDCIVCQAPVRPIVGAELVIEGHPVALLARNADGYQRLSSLVTVARMGQWSDWEKEKQAKERGQPKVTWAQVAEHAAGGGLHLLTGPATGELASLVRAGRTSEAKQRLNRWRELFPAGAISIEVQLHHVSGHEAALAAELIALAEESGVPWVATQDPRYVDERGRLVHDMLTALRYDVDIQTAAERGLLHPNGEWRLLSPREMQVRWRGREDGLRESQRVADECTGFTLDWMRPPMPDFRRAKLSAHLDGLDDDAALRAATEEGMRKRWGSATPKQRDQIDHELRVIHDLGFAGFFLVMADAIRYAKSLTILCQGRGSAANSAVAYCLEITAVDPVEHGLLFERFLSDARVGGKTEPPDIDVDFEHNRREEVLDYMYENYDRSRAAITAVTQCFHAPTAIQDAMRALGYAPEQAFEISKRVHRDEPSSCIEAVWKVAEARGVDLSGQRGRALLAALPGFDGLARLRSTHVGGFVLSAEPLGNWLPVEQTTMGRTIIQFDKDDLDLIGVPKFDFLGLGALSMVRMAFDVMEEREGTRPEMYKFADRDEETFKIIQRGDTVGMFQIESRAQIQSILHTKPDHLYDLVVQVALIRPGPIQAQFVRPYTDRRLGLEPVQYAHPALEPILKRTQGIPIFQEQAMAIAQALGGYTGAQADLLRRTMGNKRKEKKLRAALDDLERAILARSESGAIAPPVSPSVAKQMCEDLVSFSNYGFPESHAWSFALIGYVTAWLKAHRPAEFFIGLLNAQPMGFYPVSTLIHDAKRHGVEVRPPCMVRGQGDCTAEETDDSEQPAMRVGWRFVRGLGSKGLEALEKAHEAGPFTSIADVVARARLSASDAWGLARAGVFSCWVPDRRHAAWEALRACGDTLPLAPAKVSRHDPVPLSHEDIVFLDYDTVGMSIYGHPMDMVRERVRVQGAIDSTELERAPNGRAVIVTGLVTIRQRPETAKGTIFLLLEDEHGYINVIVSRKLVAEYEEVVKQAPFVKVWGRVEKDGGSIAVVGQRFEELPVRELEHTARSFR